jgi:hypothetical protein
MEKMKNRKKENESNLKIKTSIRLSFFLLSQLLLGWS